MIYRNAGRWRWWLMAPALVLVLNFWCQLHGSVHGVPAVDFGISIPWAVRAALGWILAGVLLERYGIRLLSSHLGARHPRAMAALMAGLVLSITLSSESLLVRGDEPLAVWLYEHLPLHAMFALLLVGGYLLLHAQARRAAMREPAVSSASLAAERKPATDMVEVMTGTGRTLVRITDIECLEAERNYINVHTSQRSYLLRQTLSSLEKSLCSREFLRVHRSMIVNRARIRERRQGGVLVLDSGRTVRVSRGFARQLN
jgi:hypothetical protein